MTTSGTADPFGVPTSSTAAEPAVAERADGGDTHVSLSLAPTPAVPIDRPVAAATTIDASASAPDIVFDVSDFAAYYGNFRAVRDIQLRIAKNRSRPSSGRRAAARAPCCAASTA